MKKLLLTNTQQLEIINKLKKILAEFPILPMEKKTNMYSYYRYTGKSRKLLFYIYPRSTEIIFGIGHHNSNLLEEFPILTSIADETKTVVLKIKIFNREDIEKKAIRTLIEIIIDYLSQIKKH